MRRLRLLIAASASALLSAGCGASGGSGAGRTAVGTSVVSTSASTVRAFSNATGAADSAAWATRSIQVEPDSLNLRIGQPQILFSLLRITALDAEGNPLEEFVPAFRIEDPSLFQREGAYVTPIRPGNTRLQVRPMIFDTTRVSSDVITSVRLVIQR